MNDFLKLVLFISLAPALFYDSGYAMSLFRPRSQVDLDNTPNFSQQTGPRVSAGGSSSPSASPSRAPSKPEDSKVKPTPVPAPEPTLTSKPEPKIEEPVKSQKGWSREWDEILEQENIAERLDKTPSDIKLVCPNYESLSGSEKQSFWVSFFRALAFAESSYNPLSTMVESTMGNDAVTGKQIRSEGLLQLSYQDAPYYQCDFDWKHDKPYHEENVRSPYKTIFNPERNLKCGVTIFLRQIVKRGAIFTKFYWAPLKPERKNSGYQNFSKTLKPLVKSYCY